VLRHAGSIFAGDELRFDPEHAARAGDIVLGEIDEPVTSGFVDPRIDGLERFEKRGESVVFSRSRLPRGLIAIPVGSRYALRCLVGGLHNPIDLRSNGQVIGGTTLVNLCGGCVAGFLNHRWPPGHPLTRIRVLGTVLDPDGRPASLRDFVVERPLREAAAPDGVLVGGAGMETGKTTICNALFHTLRDAGRDARYIKATGTSCFLGDPMRVQTDGASIEGIEGELVVPAADLRVADFVDACGVPSDLSAEPAHFEVATCRYLDGQAGDVCIAELADAIHHRTNVGLLRSPRFRSHFRTLIYVPDASFDAAQNMVLFVRGQLGWNDVRMAFSGPLATAPEHAALRAEVQARLGVPCLDPADRSTLLTWFEEGA
jgi:hypothetical protein